MARFSASVIIASSPAAATYFDRVAAYISERMHDPAAIAWHLDQIGLDVAYLVSDDIVLSELPPGAMLSAAPDADVPDDTYFWSVTYSVAANARKLAHPIFQKLETAPLIVVTPVYDDSDGLERTIASVARDGYSNVAHVLIDHRSAARPLDIEESATVGKLTENGGSFADLMTRVPNPIFVELPCGKELAPRALLEIMLAIESASCRLQTRPSDGSEVIDLPADVGLEFEGERSQFSRRRSGPIFSQE